MDTDPLHPTGLPFALLYRDTHLVIIDKPAGLAVHPGPRTPDSLEDYLPQLALGNQRLPVIAHRLDRDTSGCLIVARHAKAVKRVSALFEAGDDGTDKSTLDTIGLDHDVGTFSGDHCVKFITSETLLLD